MTLVKLTLEERMTMLEGDVYNLQRDVRAVKELLRRALGEEATRQPTLEEQHRGFVARLRNEGV